MIDLAELGPRICVFGPSNSGKSTLANALSLKLGVPAIHLDRFYHLPNTNWQPRPAGDFRVLHDAAIQPDRWVMDGNYSQCLPQRLERATGIVWLDTAIAGNLFRYFRRTLFERNRAGQLDGDRDSLKWLMIRHITITQRHFSAKTQSRVDAAGLPYIHLPSMRALNDAYERWGLEHR